LEVIEAASTKPFGFMRFTPGPGLGGHCIPLDPRYLSWKMQMLDFKTRLIDLASEINASMPAYVVGLLVDALNDNSQAVKGSDILVVGVAYKPDVADDRESPAHRIIELLVERGAQVSYYDPYCPHISVVSQRSSAWLQLASIDDGDLARKVSSVDAIIIVTNHCHLDYELFARSARLIIDCRGAMRGLECRGRVISLSGTIASDDNVPAFFNAAGESSDAGIR
jgi:UDP-N-acetyl-D-glucosamine dehydrogenase